MFLRLIFFELIFFTLLYLFLKFFLDKRYFGASIKVFTIVLILLIVAQTSILFVLSWI